MSLADCTRLMTTAARGPASSLPANNQALLRPIAQGRIWFSMWLLSTCTMPSFRFAVSAAHAFRL